MKESPQYTPNRYTTHDDDMTEEQRAFVNPNAKMDECMQQIRDFTMNESVANHVKRPLLKPRSSSVENRKEYGQTDWRKTVFGIRQIQPPSMSQSGFKFPAFTTTNTSDAFKTASAHISAMGQRKQQQPTGPTWADAKLGNPTDLPELPPPAGLPWANTQFDSRGQPIKGAAETQKRLILGSAVNDFFEDRLKAVHTEIPWCYYCSNKPFHLGCTECGRKPRINNNYQDDNIKISCYLCCDKPPKSGCKSCGKVPIQQQQSQPLPPPPTHPSASFSLLGQSLCERARNSRVECFTCMDDPKQHVCTRCGRLPLAYQGQGGDTNTCIPPYNELATSLQPWTSTDVINHNSRENAAFLQQQQQQQSRDNVNLSPQIGESRETLTHEQASFLSSSRKDNTQPQGQSDIHQSAAKTKHVSFPANATQSHNDIPSHKCIDCFKRPITYDCPRCDLRKAYNPTSQDNTSQCGTVCSKCRDNPPVNGCFSCFAGYNKACNTCLGAAKGCADCRYTGNANSQPLEYYEYTVENEYIGPMSSTRSRPARSHVHQLHTIQNPDNNIETCGSNRTSEGRFNDDRAGYPARLARATNSRGR